VPSCTASSFEGAFGTVKRCRAGSRPARPSSASWRRLDQGRDPEGPPLRVRAELGDEHLYRPRSAHTLTMGAD
jgi:hypothetical protein